MIRALAIPPPSHMVCRPVTTTDPLQLPHQRGEETRPGGTERMPEGDRPAVDIGPLPEGHRVRATVLDPPRRGHRGERLVDLEEVDVIDPEPGPRQHLLGGGDGTGQHQHRVDPGHGERHESGLGDQPELGRPDPRT